MKAFIYRNSKWGMLLLAIILLSLSSQAIPRDIVNKFYLILALLSLFGFMVNHLILTEEKERV